MLSRTFILYANHVRSPAEVAVCKVNGYGLRHVDPDALDEFINLVHLDVSENPLPFPELAVFTRLQSLEMAACALRNAVVPPGAFATLTTLDVSYNMLSAGAIVAFGALTALEYLDISANDLYELPMAMSGLRVRSGDTSTSRTPSFPALQTLVADGNHFTGLTCFPALAGLKTLRHLSLARNRIDFVPHLVPDTPAAPRDPSAVPFIALQVLVVTQNRIADSDDVVEVAQWPQLKEVHLWGNPLTQSRSRLPEALQAALVDQRGMTVVRNKPAAPTRPPPIVRQEDLRQVDTSLPPIATMPDALQEHEKRYLAFSMSRPSTKPLLPAILYDNAAEQADDDVAPSSAATGAASFFLTQDTDDAEMQAPATTETRTSSLPDLRSAATARRTSAARDNIMQAPIREDTEDNIEVVEHAVDCLALVPLNVPPHISALLDKHPEYAELYAADDEPITHKVRLSLALIAPSQILVAAWLSTRTARSE